MLCGVDLQFYEQITSKSVTYLSCRREEGAQIDPWDVEEEWVWKLLNVCPSQTVFTAQDSDPLPLFAVLTPPCSSEFTPGFKALLSFLTESRGFAHACLQEISEMVVLS